MLRFAAGEACANASQPRKERHMSMLKVDMCVKDEEESIREKGGSAV